MSTTTQGARTPVEVPTSTSSLTSPTPNITGDILLEAGTNELEVLVFRLGGVWLGVNVAKVREVIRPVKTIAAPHQHPSVIGMFNIRGSVLPVVDLARHLGIQSAVSERFELARLQRDCANGGSVRAGDAIDPAVLAGAGMGKTAGAREDEGRVIITEFNGTRCGFLVDAVEQIHRMSWQKVRPAPDLSQVGSAGGGMVSTTTGIIELNNRLVQMVDFESVADSILLQEKLHVHSIDNPLDVDRASKRVILAEDSPFMRSLMHRVFITSGYAGIEVFPDGQSAWEAIQASTRAAGGPGGKPIDAVISDIEMPRMDGLHLCKRIKETPELKNIPVVLFSSLISQDNLKKGQQVGATVQIPKPELEEMVRLVDKVVSGVALSEDDFARAGLSKAA